MSAEAAALPGFARVQAGLKPVLLLIGVAAAVAVGVGVVLWSQGPSYSLLYGSLSNEEAAQVTQALDAAQIPYRLANGTGAITVPSDKVNDARLKLAAKGLPESGGFALMDKDPGFGVSQFMESARYQHALETELARTISSLKQVEGARVHLAVPEQSAFVRDRHPASASVFLQLKSGRRLEREQVTAIVNLVASSIPELDAKQVTVVDSQGRLLSAPEKDGEVGEREQQFEIAHRMEEDYSQRIEALLAPIVGTGRVRAQVVAQVDTASTEEAREQYRPDSQIVRSEQASEETSRGGDGSQGVPGALTNQPPTPGTAQPPPAAAPKPAAGAPQGAAAAAAAAAAAQAAVNAEPSSSSKATTKNYEIDRTVAYTRTPAGRLQRLTVAVLVDNLRSQPDKAGKVTEKPLSKEQLDYMTTLVKDAVGFNQERGDSVSVVNAAFMSEPAPAAEELESTPIWEKPVVHDFARLGAGIIILLVLTLFVLRPLIRNLSTPKVAAAQLEAPAPAGAAPPPPAMAYEQQVAQARSMVGKDPARVAQVVKTWVQTNE